MTLSVHLAGLRNEFVSWDDPDYVLNNVHIRSWGLEFFSWAFGSFSASNWHPLTWFSLAIDYSLWGFRPAGYHLTNIVLHGANTLLVFLVAHRLIVNANPLRMTVPSACSGLSDQRTVTAAAVTALLFGLHPVHVESVAWISERKDVLYTFFYLLSIDTYCSFIIGRRQGSSPTSSAHYWLSIIFFALALISKPMAVTLPLVLLVLDWHPFRRTGSRTALLSALREKVPFFLLSLGSSLLTIMAQRSGESIASMAGTPIADRIITAVDAFGGYLYNILLPIRLQPYYPYLLERELFAPRHLIFTALSAAMMACCAIAAKSSRTAAAAMLFSAITLLPVLGIVQVGGQAMADRYVYVASLGPFLLAGVGTAALLQNLSRSRPDAMTQRTVYTAGIALIAVLCTLTVKQTGIWKDSSTLWDSAVRSLQPEERRYRTSYVAYVNRGYDFLQRQELGKALRDFDHAIELYPASYEAYHNRGLTFYRSGDQQSALRDISVAIELQRNYPNAFNDRGIVLKNLSRLSEAIADFNQAINLKPDVPDFYFNRGNALAMTGHYEDAIRDYTAAIEMSRIGHPDYFMNRAKVFRFLGRIDEAQRDIDAARGWTAAE